MGDDGGEFRGELLGVEGLDLVIVGSTPRWCEVDGFNPLVQLEEILTTYSEVVDVVDLSVVDQACDLVVVDVVGDHPLTHHS